MNDASYVPATRKRNTASKTIHYTYDQREVLKDHFNNIDNSPGEESKKSLAIKTGLTMKQVRVWFNNERAKCKRQIASSPISWNQKCILMEHYNNISQIPNGETRHELAERTGLSKKQVCDWFKNKGRCRNKTDSQNDAPTHSAVARSITQPVASPTSELLKKFLASQNLEPLKSNQTDEENKENQCAVRQQPKSKQFDIEYLLSKK